LGQGVPDCCVFQREVFCSVVGLSGLFGLCICGGVWDVMVLLLCVSRLVLVYLRYPNIFVVVFGAILVLCLMYKGVHFCAYSLYIEVGEAENFEFCHNRLGVRFAGELLYDS
jgi:hypothetical protein